MMARVLAAGLLVTAVRAAERVDFVSGIGTANWTFLNDSCVSPTYPNGVERIEIECTASGQSGGVAVFGRTADGTESQVAMFTPALTKAAFTFDDWTDFRSFRLAASGEMEVSSFVAFLFPAMRGFPLSSLVGDKYEQGFDPIAGVTSTSGGKDWLNGITLPYWQAWKGTNAVTSFSYNGGKIRTGGLYALASDINDSNRALGGFSTKESMVSWGIAFTNDTDAAIRLAGVTCSAQQWGFANTNEHVFALSFMVTNRVDWIVNFPDGWFSCCDVVAAVFDKEESHAMPVVTQMEYAPGVPPCIEPGEVLLLKWEIRPPTSGYSAMMAIDDLTVTLTRNPRPFVIHVVDGQN